MRLGDRKIDVLLKVARGIAILLTVDLFTLGNIPAAGQSFPGMLHRIAHLTAYVLIGVAIQRTMQRILSK
ncbi:MAG: hypothetical protein M0P39_05590 [Rhodocyclaceae bacterium]|jgi:hypothetical protein|nr:hypothetical protein [Rhodocyclaceae bacterium]